MRLTSAASGSTGLLRKHKTKSYVQRDGVLITASERGIIPAAPKNNKTRISTGLPAAMRVFLWRSVYFNTNKPKSHGAATFRLVIINDTNRLQVGIDDGGADKFHATLL